MSKLQETLNQMSLIMTTSEEIMKAVKKADLHPAIAEVLIKMHTQQKDLAENIKEIRSNQLALAKVIERTADVAAQQMLTTVALAERQGIDPKTLFQAAGRDDDEQTP